MTKKFLISKFDCIGINNMIYLPNHGKEFEQVGGVVQFGFARVSNVLEFQPSPDNFTFPIGDLHSLVTSIGSLEFS